MFGEKSEDLMDVFNSCWVFGRAKCGDYKPNWGRYKPDWGMWKDGTNFVASLLWTGARADCEVDAGIYEVCLHDMGYFLTFVADYRRNCSGKADKNVKLL